MLSENPGVDEILACPDCRAEVRAGSGGLHCAGCGREFEIRDGVAVMPPRNPHPAGGWGMGTGAESADPDYERTRWETPRGRRRNRKEQAVVDWFLARRPSGARILDVPCGLGRFSDLILARGARLCSVDLNFDHVRRAASRVPGASVLCIQGDMTALPLRPDSMDAALCVRVSYYFGDEALVGALREVGRVAREILLSYRDAGTLVGWWKRLTGRASDRPEKNRTYERMRSIAASAGLRVLSRAPGSGRIRSVQFLRLGRAEPAA